MFSNLYYYPITVIFDGGSGDDILRDDHGEQPSYSDWRSIPSLIYKGGEGNDTLRVGSHVKDLTLEGGSGSDTFEITKTNLFNNEYWLTHRRDVNNQPITDTSFIISDFQTGVGGDFLDISALLTALTNNYSGNNPFRLFSL